MHQTKLPTSTYMKTQQKLHHNNNNEHKNLVSCFDIFYLHWTVSKVFYYHKYDYKIITYHKLCITLQIWVSQLIDTRNNKLLYTKIFFSQQSDFISQSLYFLFMYIFSTNFIIYL